MGRNSQSFRDVRAWPFARELHDLLTNRARPYRRTTKSAYRVLVSRWVQSRAVTHEQAKSAARALGETIDARSYEPLELVALFDDRLHSIALTDRPRFDASALLFDPLEELARAGICPCCRAPRMPCDECGITLASLKIVRAY